MSEPQSWVKVGCSNLEDGREALEQALQNLALTDSPRLVVVLAASRYDLSEISVALSGRLPDSRLIGCTTAGEIAAGSALTHSLVLWALGGTGVRVSTGFGRSDDQGLRQAAVEAAS